MTEISAINSSFQMSAVSPRVEVKAFSSPESVFTASRSHDVKLENKPAKWLKPGSFDIKQFSASKEYVNGEKQNVYTDMNGNKYVSVSGADLVLLDKVKSGNLFHKARYQTSISFEDYKNLTKNTVYEIDDKYTEKKFPKSDESSKVDAESGQLSTPSESQTKADDNLVTSQLTHRGIAGSSASSPEYIRAPQKSSLKLELTDFGFKPHPAKKGMGTITVNGETMIVSAKDMNSRIVVIRDISDSQSTGPKIDSLDFKNMEELKAALQSKDYNWGKYEGIKDINDYFLP